jgi:hypothetical protein
MPWQRHVADVALETDPDTGLLVYRRVVLTVPRQSGKALDADTEVLTTRGFVTLRDIREGDEVFHPDGHPTRVTFVSDIMHGHDCYRVTTTDGRSVVADRDHLWTVEDHLAARSTGSRSDRSRSFQWRTLPTYGLVGGLMRQENRTVTTGGKQYASREFRFRLPSQGVLKSEPVELPIDPYLLGYWLGDGHSAAAVLTVGDEDLAALLEQIVAAGYIHGQPRRDRTAWRVRLGITKLGRECSVGGCPRRDIARGLCPSCYSRAARRGNLPEVRSGDGMQQRLCALGVLGDKHVPDIYLTAGTDQRLALLQGLLDTDGSISMGSSGTARVEFCSTRQVLADAALYLARSLGWRATIRENAAVLNGREVGRRWRVCFTPEASDPIPFRLPRKLARIQASRARAGELHAVSLASIEPVPSRPVRCIKVDSPDGLFLAGRDLVPTHNTTLLLAKMVHRAQAFGRAQRIAYTAQTRLKAREKWEDDHLPILEASAFRPLFTVRKQIGQEAIRWRNGSIHAIDAPTDDSGHGPTLDQGVIDEAFAREDARVEQAMAPAMITRPQPQLDVVSTAGKSKSLSPYLWGKVEAGRLAAEAGLTSGVAYFEWSAPNDAPADDPATWWACMPALGHTVTEAAVAAEFASMDLGEFRRAYLNQWLDETPAEWLVIGQAAWQAIRDPASQIVDRPAFAVDMTPDRTWASIGVVGCRADGLRHVELVEHRRGGSWVVPWLRERVDRADRWSPCAIVIAPSGPANSLIAEAEAASLEILKPSVGEIAGASGAFYDATGANPLVDEPSTVRHLGQGDLDVAVAGALKRDLGDRWLWVRKNVGVDLSPLPAVTLALWGHAVRAHLGVEALPAPEIF